MTRAMPAAAQDLRHRLRHRGVQVPDLPARRPRRPARAARVRNADGALAAGEAALLGRRHRAGARRSGGVPAKRVLLRCGAGPDRQGPGHQPLVLQRQGPVQRAAAHAPLLPGGGRQNRTADCRVVEVRRALAHSLGQWTRECRAVGCCEPARSTDSSVPCALGRYGRRARSVGLRECRAKVWRVDLRGGMTGSFCVHSISAWPPDQATEILGGLLLIELRTSVSS